jgi:hypothetical protein
VIIKFGDSSVRFTPVEQDVLLTVTMNGWRKRGSRCRLTMAQAAALLNQVCTRVGRIDLPCPPNSAAPQQVSVPRELQIAAQDFQGVVLTAQRR